MGGRGISAKGTTEVTTQRQKASSGNFRETSKIERSVEEEVRRRWGMSSVGNEPRTFLQSLPTFSHFCTLLVDFATSMTHLYYFF